MTVFEHLLVASDRNWLCLTQRWEREGRAREILGLEVEGRQHGFLSAAQTRWESWALSASAMANRADGVLDSELLRVWLG